MKTDKLAFSKGAHVPRSAYEHTHEPQTHTENPKNNAQLVVNYFYKDMCIQFVSTCRGLYQNNDRSKHGKDMKKYRIKKLIHTMNLKCFLRILNTINLKYKHTHNASANMLYM